MLIERTSNNKSRLISVALVLGLLVTGCAGAGAGAAAKQTITVSGSGEAFASPDIAIIQLGVNLVDENLSAAITQSSAAIEKVQSALAALGVEAKDIQTSSYNIWPEEVFDPESERQPESGVTMSIAP